MVVCRKASKLYPMIIPQFDNFLVFFPVACEKPISKQISHSDFRCFYSSRPTPKLKVSDSRSTEFQTSISGSRISRASKSEGEDVLFEYLHSTRSLSPGDAEHISKNSPFFLQKLLSKIDNEKGVRRSLSKFLRYHPINEFEPFFESLGLCSSELSSLLPQNLIFLSDDHVLLENFHVLRNYGIPHSKIGKMYKDARDIFRDESGLLVLTLQAYENLGLSKKTVIKLVSCCPFLLLHGVENDFVNVLYKLNRFGMESDNIVGYLSWKNSNNSDKWKRMLDTINFLEKLSCSEEQLHNLFKTNSLLVLEGSGKKVYVLFGRLLKLGLNMNEIYSLFIQNPQILSVQCEKNLLQALGILFSIGMPVQDIANIVSTHTELLCSCSFKGPKTVCRELNIKMDNLCRTIKQDPVKFFSVACKSKIKNTLHTVSQDTSQEKTAFLLRLGYSENSEEMMRALKKFRGRRDQLQERFDCLVGAGLDENTVSRLVKQCPMILNQTKEVIEKKIDYLKCSGYPLISMLSFPAYLCYNLERINHRFQMYMWLRERGSAKPMIKLSTILTFSDARFAKYFVDVHPQGPAMWESLRNTSSSN